MIKTVFLFPNGNVACTDESGQQVSKWQKPLLVDHLRRMHEAGAINSATMVETANGTFRLDQFLPLDRTAVVGHCGDCGGIELVLVERCETCGAEEAVERYLGTRT